MKTCAPEFSTWATCSQVVFFCLRTSAQLSPIPVSVARLRVQPSSTLSFRIFLSRYVTSPPGHAVRPDHRSPKWQSRVTYRGNATFYPRTTFHFVSGCQPKVLNALRSDCTGSRRRWQSTPKNRNGGK